MMLRIPVLTFGTCDVFFHPSHLTRFCIFRRNHRAQVRRHSCEGASRVDDGSSNTDDGGKESKELGRINVLFSIFPVFRV